MRLIFFSLCSTPLQRKPSHCPSEVNLEDLPWLWNQCGRQAFRKYYHRNLTKLDIEDILSARINQDSGTLGKCWKEHLDTNIITQRVVCEF